MQIIAKISSQIGATVRFSNGWMEQSPHRSPQLFDDFKSGNWSTAMICVVPSKVVTVAGPANVCGTPSMINTIPPMIEIGSNIRVIER